MPTSVFTPVPFPVSDSFFFYTSDIVPHYNRSQVKEIFVNGAVHGSIACHTVLCMPCVKY